MKPTIMWKDGLPEDPLERAQIEQILKTSGLTSTYSSIKRLHDGDDEAAMEEMKRIAEERASLAGASQPQPQAEATPGKADLARRNAELGISGTAASDRGGL